MAGFKEMRAKVADQLALYALMKDALENYEMRGLRARECAPRVKSSGYADPTPHEAVAHIMPDPAIAHMQKWVQSIEEAYAFFMENAPQKASLMETLYFPAKCTADCDISPICSKLAPRFHVSEATLYRWREEIIHAVLYAAIANDVLRPLKKRK